MVDDGLSKNQNQRKGKRHQERESCINNVKLASPSGKDYPNSKRKSIRSPRSDIEASNSSTYTKKPSERFQRGSLENVSSNPWGDLHLDGQSSLRRTRSLAITREDIFTNLDRPAAAPPPPPSANNNNAAASYSSTKPRRSQLIPRAKLIDRSRESRYGSSKTASIENLYGGVGEQRTLTKRNSSSIIQDRSPSLDTATRNRASRQPAATLETSAYSSINNLAGPKFIIGASEQLDSLESNYHHHHKPLTSSAPKFRVSYEDLAGLSLPNYYPDSKYDDTDNTDNISLTDNISTGSSKKYSSCDNISSGKWTINESERSIPYDDNIVLSANKALYDSLNHYAKPKTIRGPTPYNRDHQQNYYRRSYSSDSSEDKQQQQQHQQDNVIKEEEKISLNYFETDSNLDEINLNNENITKSVDEEGNSISDEKRDSSTLSESSIIETQNIDELKIEEEIFERHDNFQNISTNNNNNNNKENEQYKTIVTVEHQVADEQEEDESEEEKNKHSHNYLKEFLESQKGSKKPLQNFLTKKFSNLSRRNSKDINSNLADNRFHSLPDITASKNLRKCEKIDRKLRKCEKSQTSGGGGAGGLLKKVLLPASENLVASGGESRFIVNIGKHFDITANTTIPVDFELKIAKIPRKSKLKKTSKSKSEEQFLQAVKNLKQTLNNNNNNSETNQNCISKPEIIAVQTKQVNSEEAEKEIQEITMNLQQEEKSECAKEYQEKLGTMRTYWDKLMNINQNSSAPDAEKNKTDSDNPHKCKIVDVQTKIDDVKRKFEPEEVKEPEKPSKVQIAKQLFEKKQPSPEKTEKLSPFIKETCNYFERENQFESLNPNSVEIIGKDDSGVREKTHRTVAKSQSVAYPEFDHVRYRVVKSDLFQKKIFANCEKESQFDGLMQYLQDYSFQELLRDNNIVIIEPIRTKIPHETRSTFTTKNITPLLHNQQKKTNKLSSPIDEDDNANLKRHFFYHPIRVNKEVNDDELPNPDTVKQVRQFFEGGLKRSQSSQEFDGVTNATSGVATSHTNKSAIDPDKDHCSATDSNSNPSNMSDFGSQENLYESITELCCEQQYVSEEILEKIREYGSTVTYYGGRVVKKDMGQSTFTKAIMEEIKNNEKRRGECSCVRIQDDGDNKDAYQGVKFKLVKSNSCNSRLELVGTSDLQQSKDKYHHNKQKQIKQQNHLRKVKEDVEYDTVKEISPIDKNAINECIKQQQQQQQHQPPRIIAEERKMTQWGQMTKDKTFNGISFSNKSRPKITYDYHNYDNHKSKTKKLDEMEFEQYEIA